MIRQVRFASLINRRAVDRIQTIELNHGPVNLLTKPLLTEFCDTFESLKTDSNVGAVILTSGKIEKSDFKLTIV